MPPSIPPLFAFGFSSLSMLGWLAAAAAPLVIHLWNRRRFRETSWAAMRFLLAAVQKNSRRIRVEQWLLLLVRTLLILLLVTAIAGPYLNRLGGSYEAGQRTHKVVVIDGSYSMGYKPTEKSRFDRAKELAAQIVQQSNQGDGFTLVVLGDPPRTIVGSPAFDPTDFLKEVQALKLPHGGGDLAKTIAETQRVLENSARENPRLTRKEVFFLTDLGRTSWSPDVSEEAAKELRRRTVELSKLARLVVIDLGQPHSDNLAITSLRIKEPYATVAGPVTIEAAVQNFGQQPRRERVDLVVDGERIRDEAIEVRANEVSTLAFTHRFPTPGDHTIEARISGDLLDIDNHRWIAASVKERVRVLCVSGGERSSSDTRYLTIALNPEQGGGASPLQTDVISDSELAEVDLEQYDCVFLSNVEQFTTREAQLFESYLRRGGGLVFFLGHRVSAERFNRELAGGAGPRVVPVRLAEITADSNHLFDPLDYRHPIVKPFKGNDKAGLLASQVFRYWRLLPVEGSQATVALGFKGSGDPAIVEEPLHAGRSIVVAFPASIERGAGDPWAIAPQLPAFLPLVHGLLASAVDRKVNDRGTLVGQPLEGWAPPSVTGDLLTIHTPDAREEQTRLIAEADRRAWNWSDTAQSGVYEVEFQGGASSLAYAVNVDPAESDLAKLDPAELPEEFTTFTSWQNLDEAPSGAIASQNQLHGWFLYAVLTLLFLEISLAWLFSCLAS